MTPILGIDPGLTGALALYTPETKHLLVYAMPTHAKPTQRKTPKGKPIVKRQLDCHALADWLGFYVPQGTHVYLEEPNAMPKQGITSAFTFGQTCGMIQAAVIMTGLRLTLIRPGDWKRTMGLGPDKDQSRRRASQLFPNFTPYWALKSQDGQAEAALLAYYGSTR